MPVVSFKQWVATAVQSNSISSPAYISAALRIAVSLAEQVVNEELHASEGTVSLPPPFPTSCLDWATFINVNLNNGSNAEKGRNNSLRISLEPLPLDDPTDHSVDDMLGMLAEDIIDGVAFSNDMQNGSSVNGSAAGGNGAKADACGGEQNYLNVAGARLLYNNVEGRVGIPDEGLQRIYSLGLVFYQLFSGGQMPPPDLLVVSSLSGKLMSVAGISDQMGESGFSENNCDVRSLGNFANAMCISEKHVLGNDSANGAVQAPASVPEQLGVGDNDDSVQLGSFGGNKRLVSDSLNCFDEDDTLHPCSRNKRQSSFSSRSAGPSISCSGIIRCDESIDFLRSKGVPTSICDLIYNMMDSINGILMGKESYSHMFDVARDLQLMIQKPSAYLDPLDVNRISSPGLELNDSLFAREEEFSSLQSAYKRSMTGLSQLAIISGASGTGKTTMAKRLGEFVTSSGGLYISGKFDRMKVNSFLNIASAFNSYCSVLAGNTGRGSLFSFKLRALLGQDVRYIAQMMPNLRHILNDDSPIGESLSNQDCVDAQQRLQYLFCQFVEVICDCSEEPVVFFMDDVQWADPVSISIISHLLKTSRPWQDGMFFFLASCRDDEMQRDHPFWNMIENVNNAGFKITEVKLGCMNKDTVSNVVSNLLQLSPRLVAGLADIVYHKTKGNPLFVSRMLRSLNREGLLRVSLTRHRWEWDEEKIQSRKIPDDVAAFFVDRINTLAVDVKLALGTLSCFGNYASSEVINAIESDLNLNLTEPLNDAISEGLLYKMDGKYYFCHDRIQEAAYSMIEKHDCCIHHMNYGLSLMNFVLSSGHDEFVFAAVSQLNLGGPKAVQDKQQYSLVAKYNLIAGKQAMEMSEFTSAFNYFDNGISFLRKKHWESDYDLSLELYNLAAKCALAIKDAASLTVLCAAISKNARIPQDVFDASFLTMLALSHSNVTETVDYGFKLLGQLGVDISISYSVDDSLSQIEQAKIMFNQVSDEALLNYDVAADCMTVMSMKVLAKMISCLNQCKPSLMPAVTIRLVRLSLEHGLTPMSAIGFAYFGGMIADLGDLRGGYRFTKLAKDLLHRHQSNEIAGEVMWITSDTLSYIEPLQAISSYRYEGQKMSMAAGDVQSACMNGLLMIADLFWSGSKLVGVKEAIDTAQQLFVEHDHQVSVNYLMVFDRTVSQLIANGYEDTDDQLASSVAMSKNPYQLQIVSFHKMLRSLIFYKYEDMKCNAEKYFQSRIPSWYLQAGYAAQAFIGGLVSYKLYRETFDEKWARLGKESQSKIEVWRQQGSAWNFEHKSYLLEAEEAYSRGVFENAKVLYERAISSAHQHKFLHDEALANELAASFHLAVGNKSTSLEHFIKAHENYYAWNALAKVKSIYEFIQENFGGKPILNMNPVDHYIC